MLVLEMGSGQALALGLEPGQVQGQVWEQAQKELGPVQGLELLVVPERGD